LRARGESELSGERGGANAMVISDTFRFQGNGDLRMNDECKDTRVKGKTLSNREGGES